MEEKRYRDYPSYFKTLFKERVQKLSIDGGFTCPNRDGSKGMGGCTFCNNESFTPLYCREFGNIAAQIKEGMCFFEHKYHGQKYMAYFQSYSGTYASVDVLRRRYKEALENPLVVGLIVGTRPDAVNKDILDLLEEIAQTHYVCIEYGVESCNDSVLKSVNRGHTYAEAESAILATIDRGITVGAHLIFGLPGETQEDMIKGAIKLSNLHINVLKFHQLQIIKGTVMAQQYEKNPSMFSLYTLDDYLDLVCETIAVINPNVYLERFVNQAPEEYLIAPKWGVKNFEFIAKLDKKLKEKNVYQGKYYHF